MRRLSATGLLELGLDPARVLLLRVADVTGALRAAGDALTCTALGAVIVEIAGASKLLDLVTSRRLTLAAARKGVSVVLLRFAAQPDAEQRGDALAHRTAFFRRHKRRLGFSSLRGGAHAQPPRTDRGMGDGVEQ